MTVSTYDQPSYNQDGGTEYPLNIDAAFQVLRQIAQSGAPHAEDPNSKKIKVDAIEHFDGGTIISQSEQTTSEFTIPSSDDRIDRVVFDESDLSISIVQGTEASSPSAPAIPSGKIPCCQVRLSPSDSTISNDMITDERKSFLFYGINAASTVDAQNVTQTYKGNDIDSDGDGIVDKADDSSQYDGVDPSDGTDGQVYTTDGTNGSFDDPSFSNSTGSNSGDYNSEEVSQSISGDSTETVNVSEVNGYIEGNASMVSDENGVNQVDQNDPSLIPAGTTTNGNGNLNGLKIFNNDSGAATVTVRFSGIVE